MSDWQIVRIGDLVNAGALLISDGYRMKNEELGPSGTPFVRGGDIGHDGRINTNTSDHIRSEYLSRLQPKLTRPGDVAFITKGTVGRAGRIKEGQPQVVFAPQVAYWRSLDTERISPLFIYYILTSKAFQNALDAVKTHGAMAADYVSISQQYDFRLPIPDIKTQRDVASILGALDDKIDLNRRMNETLETMARTIFKDWFVNFGPVRAKMEGRDPHGLAPEIAALFPERFNDAGLPDGWRWGTLGGYAALNPESWSRATYPPEVEYVDLSGTKWGKIVSAQRYNRADAPSRAQRILHAGDTILGTVRPGNGSYAYIGREGLTGSTGFAVLRPLSPKVREFVYLASTCSGNIGRLSHLADGGAYPAVRPELVLATKVVLVEDPLLSAFNVATGSLIEKVEANKREEATLATLRDLLLPKLMSGEVRVKDVEKLVEQAA